MTELPQMDSSRLLVIGAVCGLALATAVGMFQGDWPFAAIMLACFALSLVVHVGIGRIEIDGRLYHHLAIAGAEDAETAASLRALVKHGELRVSLAEYERISEAHNARVDASRRSIAIERIRGT